MVKFDDENKIRPGQFFVCDQHIEWKDDWIELQQYIVKNPELLQNGPSIDVDRLPPDVRILVSTASGLSIFDPLSPDNQPQGIHYLLTNTRIDLGCFIASRNLFVLTACDSISHNNSHHFLVDIRS